MFRRCRPATRLRRFAEACACGRRHDRHRLADRKRASRRAGRHTNRTARRGLSFLELLVAVTILVMLAGTLAALGEAVQQGFEYCEGYGEATQHARVVLERIERTVAEATANERFPGFLVVSDQVGAWELPEVLVVWHPDGPPADPEGLPRFNELVIYCPDWYLPNQLVEITVPGDTRTVPDPSDLASWRSELAAIRKARNRRAVVLTSLLRTAVIPEAGNESMRGAVRFVGRLRPSETEWEEYQAGVRDWEDLSWVQWLYGPQTGLRQAWVRIEIQLMPGQTWVANDPARYQPLPFFGSAAVYYQLHR